MTLTQKSFTEAGDINDKLGTHCAWPLLILFADLYFLLLYTVLVVCHVLCFNIKFCFSFQTTIIINSIYTMATHTATSNS